MVKRGQDDRIELPVEQISYVPGAVDHLHIARRLWTAAQRTAQAATDERAHGAASCTSDATVVVTFAGSTTFRRVVDVPGARLGSVLDVWWSRSCHDDGHLRFHRLARDNGLFELDGSLRTSPLARRVPVEVRLSPYLGCWSLLELTPRRTTHPTRAYFRVGHESLDRFVAALSALV